MYNLPGLTRVVGVKQQVQDMIPKIEDLSMAGIK